MKEPGSTDGGGLYKKTVSGYKSESERVKRPAGLFGLEMVELTFRQKEAELKMLRFSLGETRTDTMKKENIRHQRDQVEMVWTCSEEEQSRCW